MWCHMACLIIPGHFLNSALIGWNKCFPPIRKLYRLVLGQSQTRASPQLCESQSKKTTWCCRTDPSQRDILSGQTTQVSLIKLIMSLVLLRTRKQVGVCNSDAHIHWPCWFVDMHTLNNCLPMVWATTVLYPALTVLWKGFVVIGSYLH